MMENSGLECRINEDGDQETAKPDDNWIASKLSELFGERIVAAFESKHQCKSCP